MGIYWGKSNANKDEVEKHIMCHTRGGGNPRAVKVKISWEEWDYCFHLSFLEVLHFVKYILNVNILNVEPKNYKCFFCKFF